MIFDKPPTFWTIVAGMGVWVFMTTSPNESLLKRAAKTFVSGALGLGLSTEVSMYLSVGEGPAAVAIMAFGLIVLDTMTAVVSDRKFVMDIIRGRLGVKNDKE